MGEVEEGYDDDGYDVPGLDLSDSDGQKRVLRSKWGVGQLLLHVAPVPLPRKLANDGPPRARMSGSLLQSDTTIRLFPSFQSQISSQLMCESFAVFSRLQSQVNVAADEGRGLTHTELLRISRRYRGLIREQIQLSLPYHEDDLDTADRVEELTMMERIWHLGEVFFIDVDASGLIAPKILGWIKSIHPEDDDALMSVRSEEHSSYWSTLNNLTLHGRCGDAALLLNLHTQCIEGRHQDFVRVKAMLESMPVMKELGANALVSFTPKWMDWQAQCRSLLSELRGTTFQGLKDILGILSGDEDKLRDVSRHWTDLLGGRLLYCNPSARIFDIGHHASMCIEATENQLPPLEMIFCHIMENDVNRTIMSCVTIFGDWWFVAHLTDLLYHAGKVEKYAVSSGTDLREYMILEYAPTLMSDHSNWQICAEYLGTCPTCGPAYLEEHLSRVHCATDREACKVISMCKKYGLEEAARSVSRVMGTRRVKEGNLASGVAWYVRSNDKHRLSSIADEIMDNYTKTGKLGDIGGIADSISGDSGLISDRLTFLAQYRVLHTHFENKSYEDAAHLLIRLLSSGIAPKTFWATLLVDSLPLLEAPQMFFDVDATHTLMHALELVNLSHERDALLRDTDAALIDLVRLALARNLSRAILESSFSTFNVNDGSGPPRLVGGF